MKKDKYSRKKNNVDKTYTEQMILNFSQTSINSNHYKFISRDKLVQLRKFIYIHQYQIAFSSVVHLITVFSEIEDSKNRYVIERINNLVLKRLLAITPPRTKPNSNLNPIHSLVTIFACLPKLSICHKDHQKLYKKLLRYISHFNITLVQRVIILNSMIKINIDLNEQADLIKWLLNPFFSQNFNIIKLKKSIITKLWEFLAYVKINKNIIISSQITELFVSVDLIVCSLPKTAGTISSIQNDTYKFILGYLQPQYRKRLKQEVPVGPYLLDIAMKKPEKFGFEVDGTQHYKLNQLRPSDCTREKIITGLFGFEMSRAQNSECLELSTNNTAQTIFLRKKLAPIAHLFTPELTITTTKKYNATYDPSELDLWNDLFCMKKC